MGELRRAAFGDLPVLPPALLGPAAAGPPRSRLLTAIVLGAQGSYAAAATLLGELGRGADPVVAALALAAFASHRRQLGGHAAARGFDAKALRILSGVSGEEDPDGLDARGARADAVLGLAADNLGIGRLEVARRVLSTVEATGWRARVRTGWVTAEIELAAGSAEHALAPAEAALELATVTAARRHVIKSELVFAAALGATGERERAANLVVDALEASDKYELHSLSWPASLLAADLDPGSADQYRSRADAVLHAVLLRSDPEGRRLARESRWLPV